MKTRAGLRNQRGNTNAMQPTKMVTRTAVKRQPLGEIQKPAKSAAGEAKAEAELKPFQQAPEELVADPIEKENTDRDVPSELEDSLIAKYEEIGDVDLKGSDWNNSQMVACYVKEIFGYLRDLEPVQAVRADFLCQPVQQEITPKMHKILFDWLVQVHQRFTLLPETLYLTFHIIDYYMTISGGDIRKNTYQLLGVTAMFLASKYEEIYPPEINDFVFLTDNTYSVSDMRAMERKLLNRLEFFLGFPLEIQFIRRYTKVSGATGTVHELAKYLTELSRSCYQLAHLPPSGLSAACYCLACELLADSEDGSPKGWVPQLEVFSGYSRQSLQPAIRAIARLVLLTQSEKKYKAVREKYAGKVFSCISLLPEVSSDNSAVLQMYAK